MTRDEALGLMSEYVKTVNLKKHMLAAEAVMGALAERLGEDVPRWKLTGLLHDIDFDLTSKDPERHTLVAEEVLVRNGVEPDIIHAIKCHNDKAQMETKMDRALWTSDPVTGFIVAAALIHPQKKLSAIDSKFLLNRFAEKGFARGANRDQMRGCELLGISLEEFLGLSLSSMQGIASDLGL
jgi:putative nucleotidyltransferase with HDIG domain